MAGFRLTQKKAFEGGLDWEAGLFICGIIFPPRCGSLEAFVDASHVLHPLGFKPFLKRIRSTPDKYAYAILPGCAAAEDTAKMYARFRAQLESLIERAVADSSRQKQERFGSDGSGISKKLQSFGARVYECARRRRGAFDIGHGYRHPDFQNIHAIVKF